MANRYFNKQTTNARQALAQGGSTKLTPPSRRTGGPKQPRQPNPGPKGKGRPSTLQMDAAPTNPRKKLKPFPNQAVPNRPKPKTGRPSRPMPRPRVIRDLNKRLKELQEKRKGLDPKNPKLKKSIDDLKNQIRQRPKTMIPLKSRKMSGKK